MKIKYRVFNRWWERWLRQQKTSPTKFKNSTDYVRSQCLIAILNEIEPQYIKLAQLNYKFGIKTIENYRARIYRDEYGKETVQPDPVFTNNQISNIKSKWWTDLSLLIFFGVVESFLYVLSASTFMPSSAVYIQTIAGTFFAVGMMYTLGYCFHWKQTYLEACDRLAAHEISENKLKWIKHKLQYTQAFIVGSFVAIVIAGLSRIYFFENIDHKGMTDAQYHSHVMAIKLASIFTLLFTVIVSFFMGLKKNDFIKTNVQFWEYVSWHRPHKRRNNSTLEFIKFAKTLLILAETRALDYWALVIGIKRVYQEAEFDPKFESLHAEYWKLRCRPNFIVTNEIYRKFSVIQSAYEELYRHGIVHDASIISKINDAAELMNVPKEHIAEHIKAIEEAKKGKTIVPAFSSNGHSKNEIKFTDLNQNGMKLTTVLVALFATTLLFSCGKKETKQPKNVVVPVDISGSRNNNILKWYEGVISNSIINNLGMRDGFVVLPIDSGSVQAGQEIMIANFSTNNYKNESAGQQQAQAELNVHHDSLLAAQQKFIRLFDSAVVTRKDLDGGTDLTGAIAQAKKYWLPDHKNILVVFSDMLIYASYGKGVIDFETDLRDTAQIAGYMAKIPQVDLHGWQVLIITGSQPNISAAKFSVVEKFWEQWFLACHADLRIYTSGLVSLVEKELGDN